MNFLSILLIALTLFDVSGGTIALPCPLRARTTLEPVFVERDVEIYRRAKIKRTQVGVTNRPKTGKKDSKTGKKDSETGKKDSKPDKPNVDEGSSGNKR